MIVYHAFVDELEKIAQGSDPSRDWAVNTEDEVWTLGGGVTWKYSEKLQYRSTHRKPMNKEVFKQFLKNTGAIAAGTGAGYGAGRLVVDTLKKSKRLKGPLTGWRKAVVMGLPLVGGGAAMALRGQMRAEAEKNLEDAYQRGLERGVELRRRFK